MNCIIIVSTRFLDYIGAFVIYIGSNLVWILTFDKLMELNYYEDFYYCYMDIILMDYDWLILLLKILAKFLYIWYHDDDGISMGSAFRVKISGAWCWACQPRFYSAAATCQALFGLQSELYGARPNSIAYTSDYIFLSPSTAPQVFKLGLSLEVGHLCLVHGPQRATWRSAISWNSKKLVGGYKWCAFNAFSSWGCVLRGKKMSFE